MKNSKFLPLYETIFNRFRAGSGFLEGDLVKLKKDYKSLDGYKTLATTVQARLEDYEKSGYNLRCGRLHTPVANVGAHGSNLNLPATHADVYQEPSPGYFGNLCTVPVELLEVIDTGVNLPPVSQNNKRTSKEAPYQKPTEPGSDNKDPVTDEQTDLRNKLTHAKGVNYDLAKNNTKLPHANKYNDKKPSKFKPHPSNKSIKVKESVEALENTYLQMLTEGDDEHQLSGGAPQFETETQQELTENDIEECMVKPECWDAKNRTLIADCWNEDGSVKEECWSEMPVAVKGEDYQATSIQHEPEEREETDF